MKAELLNDFDTLIDNNYGNPYQRTILMLLRGRAYYYLGKEHDVLADYSNEKTNCYEREKIELLKSQGRTTTHRFLQQTHFGCL